MVPSAYLRVFQPLDGFERAEQEHWERYLVSGARRQSRFQDRATGAGIGVIAPDEGEHAEVRIVDGRTYVAPDRMHLRVLAAIAGFRETSDLEMADRFVPKRAVRHARRQLAKQRRRDPNQVAFVHQSPWHVPIRWFTLFRDEERVLAEDPHGDMRLRYLTTTRRAMRRAENAIPILRRSDLGALGEMLVELHQWMASFDARSLVELDYGELCSFLTWDEMDDDRSAAEVQGALDALSRHESAHAAQMYQDVLTRWAEIRSRELFN